MVSPAQPPLRQQVKDAATRILRITGDRPRAALLLGTGHNSIANQLRDKHVFAADELPRGLHFDRGEGHGPLLFGYLEDVPVIVGDAPAVAYEGYTPEQTAFPVHVLRATGAELLLLTAAAASLTQQIEPGAIAVIEDHINLSGVHPLQGHHTEHLGPRFPDMSDPYPSAWRELAREVAREAGVPCQPAVLAAVPGPALPTRAEYRYLKLAGADLVGMSMVPEVVAAVHAGFPVLGLVGVTQAISLERHTPTSIEDMLDAADIAAPRIAALITGIIASFR
ncbi:MAG: purine-nucleoside phosphorylase [Planctomycetes bacterium]|nr:purine-nucleoside phosphorylase [Planctomycetota bacterium]MCB9868661.1 purine-nucleoside phosphorylase [Planctomycetota bacterium]